MPDTIEVLGYRIAAVTLEQAAAWILTAVAGSQSRLVVTLNPEIIVLSGQDPRLQEALAASDLTVADGVGILWAARRSGHHLPERVPGVELVEHVLERGSSALRVFLLGGRPGVAEKAAARIREKYRSEVVGSHHGYFDRSKPEQVLELIGSSRPQLLLAGLGEGQELFLHRHRADFRTAVMMGVGGTLDVLSGEVSRTPKWTRRLGLEWAWRVGLDPRRWHRIPRLMRFAAMVVRNESLR